MIWFYTFLFAILLALLCLMTIGLYSGLQNSRYTIYSPDLPDEPEGLKIVQLSDLHSVSVPGLAEAVDAENPDLIVCTGDLFDGVQHPEISFALLEKLARKYPVFLISGNHELYRKDWESWKSAVQSLGIQYLSNQCIQFPYQDGQIEIAGLEDLGYTRHHSRQEMEQQIHKQLAELPHKQNWRILLFHRASLFDFLPESCADLVLSGHIHGGQWRLFGQGICGPGNEKRLDFFPEYSAGLYQKGKQNMIVSRGLGDRMKIPRLFNRPDLVVITLKKGDSSSNISH